VNERPEREGREWVAIILAVGIALALNLLMFGVLWDAIYSSESGLSENATQVIIAAFGGIIGVLGSYVGFRAGADHARRARGAPSEPQSDDLDQGGQS
jgi:hypothetical protein